MGNELVHDLLDAAPPSADAMAERGRVLRYLDVVRASIEIASWMHHSGVGVGDRVIISLSRSHALDVPSFVYACSRIGAVLCIVHEQVVGAALVHVLEDAAPALVISDNAEVLGEAAIRGIPAYGPDIDFGAAPQVVEQLRVSPEAPACMIYTSGSTSRPKAVVSAHAQITFVARAIQSQLRYRPDDVIYTTQPFSFDVGLYQIFLAALCGARVWLSSPSGAGVFIVSEMVESKATVLPAVPTVAQALMWAVSRWKAESPLPRLRLLTNTGAAMPSGVLASLRERLPDLRIQLMYGLTECKRVSIMPVDGDLERPGSSGLALPETEIRIVDGEDRVVPAGVVGEVVVAGPHVMNGYWNQPAMTAEKFRVSGLRTGDFGYLDDDGYLFIEGRRDDIYKQSGFRVSASEVEAAALEIPGVQLAAVLAPKNDRDSILVVTGAVDSESVMRGLSELLELFKLPKQCMLVEKISLNQNGKIDKNAIASMLFAQGNAKVGSGG